MCIQLNDQSDPAPPIKAAQIALANPPYIPELPACLTSSERLDLETQRLLEAELCLRAATRHVEMAKWARLDAALQIAERDISLPFQRLLWADERHTEEVQVAILSSDEVEAMGHFISEVVRCRKERRHPAFDAEECEGIRQLMKKYSAAIAENRDSCKDAGCAEDHDFWFVRQHMMEANSESLRAAE